MNIFNLDKKFVNTITHLSDVSTAHKHTVTVGVLFLDGVDTLQIGEAGVL